MSYQFGSAGGSIATDTDRIWSILRWFYTGDGQIKNQYNGIGIGMPTDCPIAYVCSNPTLLIGGESRLQVTSNQFYGS